MAPVFDNNRSLLFDMDDDQLKNTDWCIGTCAHEINTSTNTRARKSGKNCIKNILQA